MFASMVFVIGLSCAQCNGSFCAVVVDSPLEWRSQPNDPTRMYLYRGNLQVGGFDLETGEYRPLVDHARNLWGDVAAPPIAPPPTFQGKDHPSNFGVDLSKIPAGPSYQIKGKDTTKAQVMEALENGIPDDRGKMRLTVIGSQEERARVQKDLAAPENSAVAQRAVLWSVPPDHWSLKDNVTGQAMFYTAANPTLYLTDARGKVLLRRDGYQGGQDFQFIRKAVSDYDAKKDPTGASGNPLLDMLNKVPWVALGGLALLVFLLILPKGGS